MIVPIKCASQSGGIRMALQAAWDKYEVALLIEAHLKIKEKDVPKMDILKKLSDDLRQKAINEGKIIDDVYRNLNGMQWQEKYIAKAFEGTRNDDNMPSKLFQEVVELYNFKHEQFELILEEAKRRVANSHNVENMIQRTNNIKKSEDVEVNEQENQFILWLKKQPKINHSINTIISVQNDCSKYATKHNISQKEFWNILDPNEYFLVAKKLIKTHLFRVIYRKTALTFDKTFSYYGEFLNERATAEKDDIADEKKDAVCDRTVETHYVFGEYTEILNKFSEWLLTEKGLSQATANGYSSNLRSLSAYCSQSGIAPATFIAADTDELQKIANQILQSTVFQTYNAEQHNRFSAALKKFLEYRVGVILSTRTAKKATPKNTQRFMYLQQVTAVLKERYPYGFRLESTIDIKRFRRYAEEKNVDIPEDDAALRTEIINVGVQIDDKVFLIEEVTFSYIHSIIEKLTLDGSQILFYDCICDYDTEGMEAHYITSAEHLKSILKQCQESVFDDIDEMFFAKNFISFVGEHTEREAVTLEMQRVWGKCQTRHVEELSEQLPAIPDEHIRRYLSGSTAFVWVSEGVYFSMERFIIAEDEEREILSFVADECESKGYASISDVPLGNTAEENYELTAVGLQVAIYNKVLTKDYRLNGKILTKANDAKLDVVSLAKQYLTDKEECTFDEMDKKVTEIAGSRYRYVAYEALYSSMVRTDKNRYVAHKYVKFDVDATDEMLSEMIKDRFVAIREITSFALFPLCGLPWNHYLLESYCYSYSKKYCLKVFGFNDKNAGVIAENSVTDGYNELLAQAAAREKIELSTEAVGQYYFETGYMGKRRFSDLESIVERAKAIREGL